MVLSLEKCKTLHGGFNNSEISYELNSFPLPTLTKFVDLGTVRGADTTYNQHPAWTASKTARVAALINTAFYSNDPLVHWSAFRSYILPILNYRSPIWNPIKKSGVNILERVQHKFTKHFHSLEDLSYTEHLQHLLADSLEHRCWKADMIITYKCLHGLMDYSPRN